MERTKISTAVDVTTGIVETGLGTVSAVFAAVDAKSNLSAKNVVTIAAGGVLAGRGVFTLAKNTIIGINKLSAKIKQKKADKLVEEIPAADTPAEPAAPAE